MVMGSMMQSGQDCCDSYEPTQCECELDSACDLSSKYRTYDGSCTNPYNALGAKKGSVYARLLDAVYSDGISKFRKNSEGKDLPKDRELSINFYPDEVRLDNLYTICIYSWGQLLAHDCTHINVTTPGNVKCCTTDNKMLPKDKWPERCAPIEIPEFDPFYAGQNVSCMSFIRAETSKDPCYQRPVYHVNELTHIIDASWAYGSTTRTADDLRKKKNGELQNEYFHGCEFPPSDKSANNICTNNPKNETFCLRVGDDRAAQNPEIVFFQILWFKYHNYLVRRLAALNPCWDDEKLYQEARRIIGAMVQHITYKYYLPYLLGESFCEEAGLCPSEDCDSCVSHFDCNCNPSTLSEFAGCAFRSFHSMVAPNILLLNEKFENYQTLRLSDYFFAPYYAVQKNAFAAIARAMCTQPLWAQDRWVIKEMTNLLLRQHNQTFGGDMESIDNRRGKDMGVPSYVELRKFCGLSEPCDFDDMEDISYENIQLLKNNYECVTDIELFPGGMMETLVPGALVGPTFRCIIAKQFLLYKCGDRFFYENCGYPSSFSPDQLRAIKKMTLSQVMCAVGDGVTHLQENAFKVPNENNGNGRVPCSELGEMCLDAWTECCD